MKNIFQTMRARFLTGFLFVGVIAGIMAWVLMQNLEKAATIHNFKQKITTLNIISLQTMERDEHFIKDQINDEAFYKNKKNDFINRRDSIMDDIYYDLSEIKHISRSLGFEFESELISINDQLFAYNGTWQEMISKYRLLGFKDFGLEGIMRNWAHKLEKSYTGDDLIFLLRLRRFEKDFLLRKDPVYLDKFNELILIKSEALQNISTNKSELFMLGQYQKAFNQMVRFEQVIGKDEKSGLKLELNDQKVEVLRAFNDLERKTDRAIEKVESDAYRTFTLSLIIFFVLAITVGLFISNRINVPIKHLTSEIETFLDANLTNGFNAHVNSDVKELEDLSLILEKLISKVSTQLQDIRAKSITINDKNQQLHQLNLELDLFINTASNKLRSPITSIQGLVNLIKSEKEINFQHLSLIEQAIKQLENYLKDIDDIMGMRRMEDREEDLPLIRPVKINLPQFVQKIVNEIKDKYEVPFTLSLKIHEAQYITCDIKRLKLIIQKVVENSFNYYDRDKTKLSLIIEAFLVDNMLNIKVIDDGIGIEDEYTEQVFDMFFRASNYSKGPGLGLYIAKESVRKLNGNIRMTSRIGVGSEVHAEIPLDPNYV